MNPIVRNIWRIFFVLVACGLIIISGITYNTWQIILNHHTEHQQNSVKLISNAFYTQFAMQEMMLSLLGEELAKKNNMTDHQVRVTPLFDRLLKVNPLIIGLGLLTPKGDFILIDSSADVYNLPNLIEQPVSKDSFYYTLEQNKMVFGRTYYFNEINSWIIPIRKAIRDKNGSILAVIAAAVSPEKPFSLFSSGLHHDKSGYVAIIRDFDKYIQFYSSSDSGLRVHYAQPVPAKVFDELAEIIKREYGRTFNEVKNSEDIYICTHSAMQNKKFFSAIRYNKRYELWTISSIEFRVLQKEWFYSAGTYFFVYVVLVVFLFVFFRYITNSEIRREESLIQQANTDLLTGLPNRNYLRNNIEKLINDKTTPFSLFYIDMDNFKNVNDSFGHQFGDSILVELTDRMRLIADESSIIIRHGGDEFLIFVQQTDDSMLLDLASRIIESISRPYNIKGFSFILGASLGIAKYPEHGYSLDILLRAADVAMHKSKAHRNTYNLFVPGMEADILHKVEIEQELRYALNNDELYMVYQPQVDGEGTIYGVEALVRWENRKFGSIPPDQFIDVAESTGLISPLGDFISNTSVSEIGVISKMTDWNPSLSINISVKQIMQSGFVENMLAVIDQFNSRETRIILEITESLFIEDIDFVLPLLKRITDSGILLSLDDFGTGYSSLNILRLLPINELKIDKSFVRDILDDLSVQAMIKNIIDIGKNLNIIVLAEGVETAEQEEMLQSFGCDRFQGYYFAKPMHSNSLIEYIKEQNNKPGPEQ